MFNTKNKNKERIFSNKIILSIFCLAMADVLVMAIPFYLKNVIPATEIAQNLGIKDSEFSQANSIYGWVSLPSYFLGGWLADKISLKKLTLIGLSLVGFVCIWYGLIPFMNNGPSKVAQVYVIFSLWSLITCFVFWAALWKLLSELTTPENNGKVNGVHGSLNGIIGTVIIAIAYLVYFLFGTVWKSTLDSWAFPTLVFIFTGFIALNVVLLAVFVKEDKNTNDQNDNNFNIKSMSTVLKNGKVWLVSMLVLGVYMYQSGLSVFQSYMTGVLLISSAVVVVLGIMRTYLFRFIFSSFFGKLADKSQKYIQFIIYGLMVASILSFIAIISPGFASNGLLESSKNLKILIQIAVVTSYLGLGITCWALVTNRWATIYVINVEQKDYGMAVGFISFFAFSADAWFWQIDSALLKKYGTENGYETNQIANQVSLLIVMVFGVLGILSGLALLYIAKKSEKNKTNLLKDRTL